MFILQASGVSVENNCYVINKAVAKNTEQLIRYKLLKRVL
jgi:hypothetical protein